MAKYRIKELRLDSGACKFYPQRRFLGFYFTLQDHCGVKALSYSLKGAQDEIERDIEKRTGINPMNSIVATVFHKYKRESR